MAGKLLGVSFAYPAPVARAHELAQSVMLDNGAFTAFRRKRPIVDWAPYYAWTDRWLDYSSTWAIIPDEIDAGPDAQDRLVEQWPHGHRGAPVWHTDEPIDRLLELAESWPLICIGSAGAHWKVGGSVWSARLDETFGELERVFSRVPRLHMLRGMAQCGKRWPFHSVDSSSVAQNHWRRRAPLFARCDKEFAAAAYAERFDGVQCPSRWSPQTVPA